jgi:hypothetical protein
MKLWSTSKNQSAAIVEEAQPAVSIIQKVQRKRQISSQASQTHTPATTVEAAEITIAATILALATTKRTRKMTLSTHPTFLT